MTLKNLSANKIMQFEFKLPQRNRVLFKGTEDFWFLQKLGTGGFSEVYLAEYIKDNKKYAIKKMNFSLLCNLD